MIPSVRPRVQVVIAAVLVVAAAAWFRVGITKASVWESEIVTVAEVSKDDAPPIPHLDYQSPAYRAALQVVGAGPGGILRARTVSWLFAVGSVAALVAAGWTLLGPTEGLAAGLVALGSQRFLQQAQLATPHSLQTMAVGIMALCVGFALHTRAWWAWISLALSGVLAGLAGMQALPALLATASVTAFLLSRRTRRDGTEEEPPVWQYVVCVPPMVVLGLVWAVTWVTASRAANAPLGKPPTMHLRYLGFVLSYLTGHSPWATWILGLAAFTGVVAGLRKRIVRIEHLRRVYVDKRSRKPVAFLVLWAALGIPAINLMLFNGRRPQDPKALETLVVPLLLLAARGMATWAEWVSTGLYRAGGLRVGSGVVSLVLAGAVGLFGQAPGRAAYRGFRLVSTPANPWADAASFLQSRAALARVALVAPATAVGVVRGQLGQVLSGTELVPAMRASQVDSIAAARYASWALVYQSELFHHIPDKVRLSLERHFQEVTRFQGPERSFLSVRATPWLVAAEAQWSQEWERALAGGPEAQDGWLGLARLYADAGRPDSARAAIRRVLDSSPNHYGALMEMGFLSLREGRPQDAASWFSRALEVNPLDTRARYSLARLMWEQGEYKGAATLLEGLLSTEPSHLQAAQLLIQTYRALGQGPEAEALERRIATTKGRFVADYEFGRVFLVRTVEVPTQPLTPGDEASLVIAWSTLSPFRGTLTPRIVPGTAGFSCAVRARAGGWSWSLPDTGFVAGLTGVDTLWFRLVLVEPPRQLPDRTTLELEVVDQEGRTLPATSARGIARERVVLARVEAWRAGESKRTTVEAQQMDQHPGFPLPDGINVAEPGLAHTFRFPGGPVFLEVTARGTPAGGQWPRMVVEVGSQVVRDMEIADREWRTYSLPLSFPAGQRTVRIRFPNDYVNPVTGEDRNLVVSRVSLVEEKLLLRLEAP